MTSSDVTAYSLPPPTYNAALAEVGRGGRQFLWRPGWQLRIALTQMTPLEPDHR